MSTGKRLLRRAAALLCPLVLTGCAASQPERLTNERFLSLDGIAALTISYDEESLVFFESDSDRLILREYMTADDSRYHARVTEGEDGIQIREGGKPLFKGDFSRRVEVGLPPTYHGRLTVTTTDGPIDLTNVALDLSELRVDSTSGEIRLADATATAMALSSTRGTMTLERIAADDIHIETTDGNVYCDGLSGSVTYATTHGSADFRSAVGCGSYTASNSGDLYVAYIQVSGDLSLFNKNGDIHLTLPKSLSFRLTARTKNGTIQTDFPQLLAEDDAGVSGVVGENPAANVTVETRNGAIRLAQ
ncbi:MAG: DUF4097 family beta strand repeat-containing protein [Clostridia bacterium]|nr:DUF4097 family beta strand repeat-containing protein [Clostridia bacterium]